MIADTSFIIDIMNGDARALEKARKIEADGLALSISSISVFELYIGVSLSRRPESEISKVLETISSLPLLPLDYEGASHGGQIYVAKLKSASGIDPTDAMIAGISRALGESIVTRNTKHFEGIQGVKVETY